MPGGHFYVFFGEMSEQVLCPFLKSGRLLLSCKSSLYILDIHPFIRYVFCKYFLLDHRLHILLIVSFIVQKLFSLKYPIYLTLLLQLKCLV